MAVLSSEFGEKHESSSSSCSPADGLSKQDLEMVMIMKRREKNCLKLDFLFTFYWIIQDQGVLFNLFNPAHNNEDDKITQ